jgi:hypothetical protein
MYNGSTFLLCVTIFVIHKQCNKGSLFYSHCGSNLKVFQDIWILSQFYLNMAYTVYPKIYGCFREGRNSLQLHYNRIPTVRTGLARKLQDSQDQGHSPHNFAAFLFLFVLSRCDLSPNCRKCCLKANYLY